MTSYTKTTMVLHWLMALLIIAAFFLGITMTDIPGLTPTKLKYYSWHKWLGVTVFLLACIRLLWRIKHAAPPYPASMPAWQQKAAHGVHHLLYLLFFLSPISGYFYSLAAGVPVVYLGVIPLPVFIEPNKELKVILKEVHELINYGMLVVVLAHVGAAFKHHFIEKDGIFKRILPLK
ncbi:MAG: cytochrome b [Burkholderiales bacterium]|nr:cytochrome b [Burkholderiales bacterium]